MSKQIFRVWSLLSWIMCSGPLLAQVGIGTTTPNPRAVLELSSTSQGFLPPRVNHTTITGLAGADAGLWVFNPNTGSHWYWDGGLWREVEATGNVWQTNGTDIFRTLGNVGIGTNSPVARLGVAGSLAVGNAYAAGNAPQGGLAVEGATGIGTNSPDPSAKLEVHSTHQGVLFPRLTTAQRDAIANPANGLLIYNTETRKLEAYDQYWGWLNTAAEIAFIDLTVTGTVQGYNLAAAVNVNNYNIPIYVRVVNQDTMRAVSPGGTGFTTGTGWPPGSRITLVNNGLIAGGGGNGGNGADAACFDPPAQQGQSGGHAIELLHEATIENYGTVQSGGGGGGGSGSTSNCLLLVCISSSPGAGGGGGAGIPAGGPGVPGTPCGGSANCNNNAQSGNATLGGAGGGGGNCAVSGGNGGDRGLAGTPGPNASSNGGLGGPAGRRVKHNGNAFTFQNLGAGVSFGIDGP